MLITRRLFIAAAPAIVAFPSLMRCKGIVQLNLMPVDLEITNFAVYINNIRMAVIEATSLREIELWGKWPR